MNKTSGFLKVCMFGTVMSAGLYADISITNPSFETPIQGSPGYTYYAQSCATTCPTTVDGWTFDNTGSTGAFVGHSGGAGIAANGSAFTNTNDNAPDGKQVLFLQNQSSASQLLHGFTVGDSYTLSFYLASRNNALGPYPELAVTFSGGGGAVGLFAQGAAYKEFNVKFQATSQDETLTFAGVQPPDSDRTLFIDDVSITPEPGYFAVLVSGIVGLIFFERRRVRSRQP